jgi:hypothetical protein
MPLSPETSEAVRRYGPSINRLARRRYGISGQDLLAKLVVGESGDNPDAVSSAGARGRTQFMPTSRAEAIRKFGVDPWGSADDAVHAAVLHLQGKINGSKGLEGYNPGDPNYPKYILGQPVSGPGGRPRGGGGQQTPSGQGPTLLPPGLQVQPGPGTAGLLASLLQDQSSAPPTGSLRPSPIAASATLPAGYRGIQTAGGPAPRRDVSSLLEALSGAGAALPGVTPGQVVGDAENGGNPRTGRGQASGKSAEGIINDLQGFVTGELGLPAGSRDRDRAGNAAAGGSSDSDHLEEQGLFGGREALDILTTPAQGGWDQYAKVARRFGLKPDKGGFTQGTVKIGERRFRVQVIFGDQHDHGDHIHVGVRRV